MLINITGGEDLTLFEVDEIVNKIVVEFDLDKESQVMDGVRRLMSWITVNKKLHWTTVYTEKVMLAVIGGLTVVAAAQSILGMIVARNVTIADLFLLFIYLDKLGNKTVPIAIPAIAKFI